MFLVISITGSLKKEGHLNYMISCALWIKRSHLMCRLLNPGRKPYNNIVIFSLLKPNIQWELILFSGCAMCVSTTCVSVWLYHLFSNINMCNIWSVITFSLILCLVTSWIVFCWFYGIWCVWSPMNHEQCIKQKNNHISAKTHLIIWGSWSPFEQNSKTMKIRLCCLINVVLIKCIWVL